MRTLDRRGTDSGNPITGSRIRPKFTPNCRPSMVNPLVMQCYARGSNPDHEQPQ